MDLLEKILSGKDPGREKNGCVSHLFDWETQRFPLPTKRLQNNDARERACQKLELCHPVSTSYFYSIPHGHNNSTIRMNAVPVSFFNCQVSTYHDIYSR